MKYQSSTRDKAHVFEKLGFQIRLLLLKLIRMPSCGMPYPCDVRFQIRIQLLGSFDCFFLRAQHGTGASCTFSSYGIAFVRRFYIVLLSCPHMYPSAGVVDLA